MLSNKNIELLIAKIDDGVKLGVKRAFAKIKASEHPSVPIQKNGKVEWVNLKETN
ncbi:MAG: hypothetical protein KBE91_03510 [Bacteroidia bacterium]|nr:hypothetical protein [Bacteroidia bacterium]MBP9688652.1 hypothetical protein [Bacteroidia bacterium]